MLDQLSRGRLQLGIGRGAVWPEQEIYGLDPTTSAERYTEARDLVLLALTNERVSYSGKHFRVPDFHMVLRPFQKPRPPLWYGIGNPESAPWAAAQSANAISLQPAAMARRTLDRYRDEWQRLGRAAAELPFLGLARHIVVAETDAEAKAVARAAFPRWRKSFSALWEERGVPLPLKLPLQWDEFEAAGQGIAGSPASVRAYLTEQAGLAGASFFLCQMVFGEIRHEEALRSLTLFAREVAPQLAN